MAAILYAIPLTAVAAASSFGWMLAYLGGADIIMGWVRALGTTDPRAILCFVAVLFLIVGDFLDGLPAIIILMPVILSLERLGHINSVHMGVVVIVTLAFGLITPPCGIILLLSSTLAGVSFSRALRQSAAIYIVFLVVIAVIILLPGYGAVPAAPFSAAVGGLFPTAAWGRVDLSLDPIEPWRIRDDRGIDRGQTREALEHRPRSRRGRCRDGRDTTPGSRHRKAARAHHDAAQPDSGTGTRATVRLLPKSPPDGAVPLGLILVASASG